MSKIEGNEPRTQPAREMREISSSLQNVLEASRAIQEANGLNNGQDTNLDALAQAGGLPNAVGIFKEELERLLKNLENSA